MRVLLVSSVTPEFRQNTLKTGSFPNGLLSIAAVLEQHNHQVRVYDTLVDEKKPEDFADFDPELIGFGVITGPNIKAALSQSKAFRNLFPGAKIVWGNVCASVLPEQTLLEPYIDFVAVGAGEYTLLELLQNLQGGNPDLHDIKGLVYREGSQIHFNQPREFIDDLDQLPDPAWHLVEIHKYGSVGLNTSRGCAFKCSYCYNGSFSKGHFAYSSAAKVITQIKTLKSRYDIRHIRINDDNFTFDRRRLREFCNALIEEKMNITWACDSRADLEDADIALMAKSGCVAVALGIESGSQRLLDFVEKRITVSQIEKTFWLMVKHRIRTSLYLMYGLPTETVKDFELTQKLLERLDNPYSLFTRYIPFPGSVLYNYCVTEGLINPPRRLGDWVELIENSDKLNLSEVPDRQISDAIDNWRKNYAKQRVRFAIRHNPSYFLTVFTNPLQFARDLLTLFSAQWQIRRLRNPVS